jgi:hypothetical protein
MLVHQESGLLYTDSMHRASPLVCLGIRLVKCVIVAMRRPAIDRRTLSRMSYDYLFLHVFLGVMLRQLFIAGMLPRVLASANKSECRQTTEIYDIRHDSVI